MTFYQELIQEIKQKDHLPNEYAKLKRELSLKHKLKHKLKHIPTNILFILQILFFNPSNIYSTRGESKY